MNDAESHDAEGAVKLGAKLSGNAYISVQHACQQARTWQVAIHMQPYGCNHGVTICRDCAYGWEWDYVVHYDRTCAGRSLRDENASAAVDPRSVN